MPARPGPRGPHKLTEEILTWAEEQLAADPALRPAQLPDRIEESFGVRVHPAPWRKRWPAAVSATPKAADLPARETRKEENPSLSLLTSPGHAAAEPENRPDAGQDHVPGGGFDARYEQLRHAALHARAEAFPLGLGVLTGKGVTAWRHALAGLTLAGPGPAAPAARPPGTCPAHAAGLPAPVAAGLINVLAAVALAAAGPSP